MDASNKQGSISAACVPNALYVYLVHTYYLQLCMQVRIYYMQHIVYEKCFYFFSYSTISFVFIVDEREKTLVCEENEVFKLKARVRGPDFFIFHTFVAFSYVFNAYTFDYVRFAWNSDAEILLGGFSFLFCSSTLNGLVLFG